MASQNKQFFVARSILRGLLWGSMARNALRRAVLWPGFFVHRPFGLSLGAVVHTGPLAPFCHYFCESWGTICMLPDHGYPGEMKGSAVVGTGSST